MPIRDCLGVFMQSHHMQVRWWICGLHFYALPQVFVHLAALLRKAVVALKTDILSAQANYSIESTSLHAARLKGYPAAILPIHVMFTILCVPFRSPAYVSVFTCSCANLVYP